MNARTAVSVFALLLLSGGLYGQRGPIPPQNDSVMGDRTTHIYNPPGDNDWPLARNRVYFDTEAQAVAAGYHKLGTSRAHPKKTLPLKVAHIKSTAVGAGAKRVD